MAENLHPVELELASQQSLEAITSLTREEAIAEAAYLCTLEWVRAARREGTLEVLVLGRFDLAGEQPWPSLGLLVTRREDRRRGVRAKAAMLFLYLDEAGQWAVNERLGPPNGVPSVPWTYYAGVLAGPPSTLNGEWPRVTGLEPRGSGSASSGSSRPGESGSSAAATAAGSSWTSASLLARLRARLGSILRRKENRAVAYRRRPAS
jgi:hypothetical protein